MVPKPRRYVVTIGYREPTFERRMGTGPQHREGSFVVFAENEALATRQALAEFRRTEAASWVGWTREVDFVLVYPKLLEGGTC